MLMKHHSEQMVRVPTYKRYDTWLASFSFIHDREFKHYNVEKTASIIVAVLNKIFSLILFLTTGPIRVEKDSKQLWMA